MQRVYYYLYPLLCGLILKIVPQGYEVEFLLLVLAVLWGIGSATQSKNKKD